MNKYILKEDVIIFNKIILSKDSIIEFDENNQIDIVTDFGPLKLNMSELLDKIEKYHYISVEFSELGDEEISKWYRLQLDVKTTREKAIEIESYLRNTLEKML